MALIERGTGENVQQDNNLSVKVNLELPKKGSFTSSEGAGSIALKPNNLLSYKGNDDITYEIPLGGGVSNLQGVLTAGNVADKAIHLTDNTESNQPDVNLPINKGIWLESRDYDGGTGGSLVLINPVGTAADEGASVSIMMQVNDYNIPNKEISFRVGEGNIVFSDPSHVDSLGIAATFSDRVKGVAGVEPDELVIKSQLDSSTGTLESVTNGAGNNITPNSIIVSGAGGLDLGTNGIHLLHVPDGSSAGVVKTVGGVIKNSVNFEPTRTQLIFAGTDTLSFDLRDETSLISGAVLNSRLEINPAINTNDAATKGYVDTNFAGLTTDNVFSGANSFTDGTNTVTIHPMFLRARSTFLDSNVDVTAQNIIYAQGSFVQSLGNEVLTANRNIRLPNADGIVALTSNLSVKANLTGGNTFTGNQVINANIGVNVTPTSPLHVKGIVKIERTNTTQYMQIDSEGGSTNILGKNTTDGTYNQIIITQGNNTLNREVLRFDTVGNTLIAGKATITGAPVNATDAVRKTELDLKANIASPSLTGTPLAPTAAAGTNTTQIATTAYVFTNYAVKSIESSATTAQTSATLNASYPSVASGQVVVAPLIATGMLFIKKVDGNWMSFTGANI